MTCAVCGGSLPSDARFCPTCGTPVVVAPRERRLVTAIFCDVVGSTSLAERFDAEVLSLVMTEYRELARKAIEHHGGSVATFQGDGVVGLFGLPATHEDDAIRAARAGLDLIASLGGAREAAAHGIGLQARVGIESGEVLGDLALASSGALSADVLNTAARLQAEAEPGTVIVGEVAVRLLRDQAELRPLPPMILKGKAEPIAAAIVASIDTTSRSRSLTPFVGRARQIEALTRAFEEAVVETSPVLVTILGEPGIGKSRILDAFVEDLPGATVLRTSVPTTGEASSMAPVAELVAAAGGGGEPSAAADRLTSLLVDRPDAVALGASLRSILGFGDESAAEPAWALRRLLETLAARMPVIVVVDDLHWASPALLDLLEDVARWTRGPILFVCAARPDLFDVRPTWGGGWARALAITVSPLVEQEARKLAEWLLPVSEGDADRLVKTAEGNPLFLEHLAVEARERGAAWDPSAAPTTIRAVLEARLDRSSPEVARVLSVASVQGSRFSLNVVRALAPGIDIEEALRDSERAHLAKEISPDVGAFAHALVRETAYGRLPKAIRADLHAEIAGLLGHDDELAGTHLERAAALRAELGHPDAGLEERAGERLARTGAGAFARLDLSMSSALLERAAKLLPHGSLTRLEMLPDLAVALMESGRSQDARALLARAVEEAEGAGSRRDALRVRLQQLALYVYIPVPEDETRRGIVEGHAILDELGGLGDDVGLAQGWIVVDYLHYLVGEMASAEDACERSVSHAERAGRLREQVQAGGDQATSLMTGPRSVADLRERAARMRESANPIVAAGGAAAQAVAAALAGDASGHRAAESHWRHAVEVGGLEWPGADHAVTGLPLAQLEMGNPEAAEALAREGLDTMERLGDVWIMNDQGWILPLAVARQGRSDEAALLADAMEERYSPMGVHGRIFRNVALSQARSSRGNRSEALALATEAATLARTTDSNLYRTISFEHLADMQRDADPAAAIRSLEEAATIHAASGNAVGSDRVVRALESLR
jgi:class 3 adenylate cyclase